MLYDLQTAGFGGLVGRAIARDAFRGFDPCWRYNRGVAVDFGPKQSGWLINQLGHPSLQTAGDLGEPLNPRLVVAARQAVRT